MRYFLIIFFLFIQMVFSESIQVKGFIQDAESQEGLGGANIYVPGANIGATSSEDGTFIITFPQEGAYIIKAGYVGYEPGKIKFKASSKSADQYIRFSLKPLIIKGQTIVVTETRAKRGSTPVSFSNMDRKEITEKHDYSDIPMLINDLPNVYSFSLNGDPLGYSFVKIRGFDQKRIGVMINDIPLNDPEDHQVYWVDMPDFAESVNDIQVQRGVGTSVYGTSTFGGSININTDALSKKQGINAKIGFGSYNTRKFSVEFNSKLIDDTYSFYARFSKITSDGFRDNSASDLWAYYISAAKYSGNFVTKINLYGGPEITHPDWYGIPDYILKNDRHYKWTSYKNDMDNFNQPHYELISEWKISPELEWKNTFYYIRGEGYYEGLKTAKKLRDFGMENLYTTDPNLFGADSLTYYENNDTTLVQENGQYIVKRTDLVRQKWVKKNQYGWISRAKFNLYDGEMMLGFSAYGFDSDHSGYVTWGKHIPYTYEAPQEYYGYYGNKKYISAFFNYLYNLNKNTLLMTNILYEHKKQDFDQKPVALYQGDLVNAYSLTYDFLSPRLGLNYKFNENLSAFINASYAEREPSDDDLYDTWQGPDDLGVPPLFANSDTVWSGGRVSKVNWSNPYVKPEELFDFEFGANYSGSKVSMNLNLYYMMFNNEIVPFGSLDKDGNPIKGNAEESIHSGVEFSAKAQLHRYLSLSGNISYSHNYFNKFMLENWDGTQTDMSGNTIAGFPGIIANLRLSSYINTLFNALSLQYIGKQYLDNTENEARIINPYFLLNYNIAYTVKPIMGLPGFKLMLKINNLLDSKYETAGYYDSWYNTAYFWPGAGRNFYASIQVNL
jgi:iron complex outermembrane receptor protein